MQTSHAPKRTMIKSSSLEFLPGASAGFASAAKNLVVPAGKIFRGSFCASCGIDNAGTPKIDASITCNAVGGGVVTETKRWDVAAAGNRTAAFRYDFVLPPGTYDFQFTLISTAAWNSGTATMHIFGVLE